MRGGDIVNRVMKSIIIALGVQLFAVPFLANAEGAVEQTNNTVVATEKKPVVKKNKNSIINLI